MKIHFLIHTGEKPHKCNQCNFSANQAAHLRTHIMKHTGEKPRKCKQCDYTSTHSSEEPQKDPLSHYKTVRDGRRDVAAEASAHINLGTHLKIYNGRKVIQSYVLIQHLLFIQGKSHVSARSLNSRTNKIAVSRRTCYWHSFTRISYRRYGQGPPS